MSAPQPLGIDNVLFAVDDLGAAVRFYELCGLKVKFRMDQAGMALFAIGGEEPGLMIRKGEPAGGGRLWLEVRDAAEAAKTLAAAGIETTLIETATGITAEARDPSGNVIGFADYSKRPELARY
jgi:catechol 2,3-dioxygenase-like lactoylglutathione lyase family enzyme